MSVGAANAANGAGEAGGAGPGAEWAGPWANDAQRLFRMLQQAPDGDGAGGAHSPQSHASPAECRYCPLCQALATIRRSGPELLDKVAEFAAGLAATLRATGPAPDQDQEGDLGHDRAQGHDQGRGRGQDRDPDGAGGDRAGDDPAAGAGWAASVDDVTGVASQDVAGPARDVGSTPGPPDQRPDQTLVPQLVRIDITD